MKKLARPALITICAAAIVFAAAIFAASRSAQPSRAPEPVDYQTVTSKISVAPRSVSQGVPLQLSAALDSVSSAGKAASAPQIARVGSISLLVPNVDKAVSAVSTIARAQTGDVLSLDDKAKNEHGGAPSADMAVRVPDDRFEATMSALSRVGTARARSISAEDLTTQIVDSAARLRNLRRTEVDIQKIMDRSGSVGQILAAENQLSSVREQIETTDAELKDMRSRVSYSTISVSLAAEASNAPVESSASAQLVSEWRAARHAVAQFTIGLLAVGLWTAAFVPYLLLVALCWLLLRRRLSSKST